MSQQELERTDQEVIDLVNGAAAPDATDTADQIEARIREIDAQQKKKLRDEEAKKIRAAEEEKARQEARFAAMKRSEEQYMRRKKMRDTATMLVCLLCCIAVSGLLIVSMLVPEFIVWTANIGILICGIVAGAYVARWLQQRKRWW